MTDQHRDRASDVTSAMARAAMSVIESRLDRNDLSPAMVAQVLGVPLRTLHRSFAAADDSIMAFARRRRLQEAHDELVRSGNPAAVSEVAARWHFSDASHFIRHFKSCYGVTPAAYLRNRRAAAAENLPWAPAEERRGQRSRRTLRAATDC
ncbi:helix-turn-helix transcriptional regulator [Streptomyces sp. CWNU-52B]|uniref:helix-turn-helix transcriptional regulator n=1 Tax=unclassified Streptomyces TaxID=2593676 RepID=UPI0039C39C47